MKLLIASDIHGSAYWCQKLCAIIDKESPDRLILLGDLLYHGPRNDLPKEYAPKKVIQLLSQYAGIIIAVRGNCDAEVDQMVLPFPIMSETSQLLIDNTILYLVHGHHLSPDALPALPEGSVVLSGHTHIKKDETVSGIRYLNPGSVSIPKDSTNSVLLYDNGVFKFCTL